MATSGEEESVKSDDYKESNGIIVDPLSDRHSLDSAGSKERVDSIEEEINIDNSPLSPSQSVGVSTGVSHNSILPTQHSDGELFITIDNPEKHVTTMESYTTFRVSTKTTRGDFDSPEYSVRRRFNDFIWIRQMLTEAHSAVFIPPLPEKHSMKRIERFNKEFLALRQIALQKFVQRCSDHVVLSHSEHFKLFLTLKQHEFQAHKKQGSGFLSRVGDSLYNMGTAYMMKNRSPEFTAMSEYVQALGEKLSTIDRISSRIMLEQTEYMKEINEWAPVFALWSNSEGKLSKALSSMSDTIDKCAATLQQLVKDTEVEFSVPLKEYILYTDAIKMTLKRRDAIFMEYQLASDELNKKKNEREFVKISDQTRSFGAFIGKDPQDVKQEKCSKLEQKVEELTKQVDVLHEDTLSKDSDLKADWERWQLDKKKDFKKIFTGMADRQIDYYQTCLAAWESLLPEILTTDKRQDSDSLDEQPLDDHDTADTLDN